MTRLLRLAEVERLVGIKRSTIYALCRQGRFPAPIKYLGRYSAWVDAEVLSWIDTQIRTARDPSATKTQVGDEHRSVP